MNRKLKATLIGGTLLTLTGAALAFGGPDGDCGRHGGKGGDGPAAFGQMRAIQQLDNLSSEQQAQLDALRQSQQSLRLAQRQAMKENHKALREALQNNADAETIKRLAEAKGQAVTAMIMQRAEMKRKVDAILTEEQRKALAAMPQRAFDDRMGPDRRR